MKNVKKYVSIGLLLVLAVALVSVPVSAVSTYLGNFESAYASAQGTRIDNCNLCHTAVPTRNSFGSAFANNGHNFDATLEQKDSDGDGFKNIDEINALTFPGDPNDHPAPPPQDTTAPVITILGANPVDVLVGSIYNDAGATALDNVDGDLTASITATSNVNTAVEGTYSVVYTVSDAAGNPASATRTVNVVAAPPPTTQPPTDEDDEHDEHDEHDGHHEHDDHHEADEDGDE